MWPLASVIAGMWRRAFTGSAGTWMHAAGALLLAAGAALGAYSMRMAITVTMSAREMGYSSGPEFIEIASAALVAQRQHLLILAGCLAIMGSIFFCFANIKSRQK